MELSRTLLVGGVSGVHDALLAAALRGAGLRAEPVGVPTASSLAVGRGLLARGHCNPTYYLAGALVERLRREVSRDVPPSAVAARFAHLTLGSCGPCRFATYASEFRRALAGAGLGEVPVVAIDQLLPAPGAALAALGVRVEGALLVALARAVAAADVLVRAGCEARPRAREPAAVDVALADAEGALGAALAERRSLSPALRALRDALSARVGGRTPRLRALLTGEFFAATTDGHGGYGLVRWLEARGARVTPPLVVDWLGYLAWQVRRDCERRLPLWAPDPGPRGLLGRDGQRLQRRAINVAAGLGRLFRRYARAAGVSDALTDQDDLAALAAPHYHLDLRGGMGHLEVGAFLAAVRDHTADLVVSLKPFGCLPSSAVSDGVNTVLARRVGHVRFVAVETTGDAEAAVESRLELALERAREGRGPLEG